jgi:hypothetical protein
MMAALISGGIIAGYLVCGLFFLKFWKSSVDRLFLIFAVAFWMLAAQRLLLVWLEPGPNVHLLLYVMRLVAFVLILAAIVDKNWSASAPAA